ncbi:MAG: glucose-6-phosphate isomerase [Proteobacteria bacterium]|nr:glucose-6-phosphate isomerase [Pseudomonadota bacterium]HQR04185.1 glucose-6-phosphate isomerase [Rhodocyclaceae bacterium]
MARHTESPSWQMLRSRAGTFRKRHLRDLFAGDPDRFRRFSVESDGLLLDFSKQRLDAEVLQELIALWEAAGGSNWHQRMEAGEAINHTEGRAALHSLLRWPAHRTAPHGVPDVLPAIRSVQARMRDFCAHIHSGIWRGASGQPIRHVVNIGIGGSDLGPRMVDRALAASRRKDLHTHYVSNLDGAHLGYVLSELDPAQTLFIVASKTFTTQETLQNARTARSWIVEALGESAVAHHFVAISTNHAAVAAFGIAKENAFGFWDWVGGRFSLWSAIGLPLALSIGFDHYERLLAGAAAMDEHFRSAPAERNLPLLLALIDLWNTTFLGAETRALLPYSQSLELLPHYLQQLEMESNGKRVDRQGAPVNYSTAPILWGEAGTGGQHAFYQLLHQGGRLIPCEFIALRQADFPLPGHHEKLLANCFAQSEALMRGRTLAETTAEMSAAGMDPAAIETLAPYRVFPGNQPSTTLLLPRLDPYELGRLIALYEHKVFALGVLWNLNSFDQWGVEYGKQLAGRLLPLIESGRMDDAIDSSTAGLIAACRASPDQEG